MKMAVAQKNTGGLAPWRWHDGLLGLAIGLLGSALLVWQRPVWHEGWLQILAFWVNRLGLTIDEASAMPVPSGLLLLATAAGAAMLWLLAGTWREVRHPLRVIVRSLCLVQTIACAFFFLAPARFPYGLSQHLNTLLMLEGEFMVAIPLMLGIGWGVLRLPWRLKLLAPAVVVLYFALLLPHQVVLHAWVLTQASVLFMPMLFLCFGLLLDSWLFIALYAWLASLTPRHQSELAQP